MIEDMAREAQRQYLRQWRKRNPEKVKKYNREYWIRRVQKEQAQKDAEKSNKGEI